MLHQLIRGSTLIALIAIASCRSNGSTKKNTDTSKGVVHFRQAAEFEPTEAIWLMWPQVTHKKSESIPGVTKSIIQALVPYTKIKLVVANDSLYHLATQSLPDSFIKNGVVSILRFPYHEFWARDFGPAFLVNEKGEKAMADFKFTDWGYSDISDTIAKLDEKLDERIATYYKIPIIATNLISEGGDHEVNGKGTLLVVESVEKDRNPALTLNQIEDEFKRVLGVRKVIWLKQGVRDDDKSTKGTIDGPLGKKYYTVLTTNGHVDEFARFVNDTTILVAYVNATERNSPLEQETGRRMDENFKILSSARDQDGKYFHIIKMPMPYPVVTTMSPDDGVYDILSHFKYDDGSRFAKGKTINVVAAASYLNFLIANQSVLVAKYWRPGMKKEIKERDEQAISILQKAFPHKKIIQLDALAVNLGGGGMHCITINEPKTH